MSAVIGQINIQIGGAAALSQGSKAVVPLQHNCVNAFGKRNALQNVAAAKVMGSAADPCRSRAGVKAAGIGSLSTIASCREVAYPIGMYKIYRLRNYPILKERFCDVADVIYDDVTAFCCQCQY